MSFSKPGPSIASLTTTEEGRMKRTVLVMMLLSMLAGCAKIAVRPVTDADKGRLRHGIFYALPRTVVDGRRRGEGDRGR
jgi:hypothetical protein